MEIAREHLQILAAAAAPVCLDDGKGEAALLRCQQCQRTGSRPVMLRQLHVTRLRLRLRLRHARPRVLFNVVFSESSDELKL